MTDVGIGLEPLFVSFAFRATLPTALYQAHTQRAELQQLMGLALDATAEDR